MERWGRDWTGGDWKGRIGTSVKMEWQHDRLENESNRWETEKERWGKLPAFLESNNKIPPGQSPIVRSITFAGYLGVN